MNNPPCPACLKTAVNKNGTNNAGTQQYICLWCDRSFTGGTPGRPTIGDKPLTPAEMQERYRVKQKERQPTRSQLLHDIGEAWAAREECQQPNWQRVPEMMAVVQPPDELRRGSGLAKLRRILNWLIAQPPKGIAPPAQKS
jgi:hypothetical protein